MPQSYIEYSSGLTATTFSVPFKYLNIEDVNVVGYNGVSWTPLTIASRSEAANTVTLSAAPSAYSKIRVYRQSTSNQLVDFQAGARLTESELDTAYNQSLFVAQEVSEDANTNQFKQIRDASSAVGNSLSNFASQAFTANSGGTQTEFSLTAFTPETTVAEAFLVSIDGVIQSPTDAYTISRSPAKVTLTSAAPANAKVVIVTTASAAGASSNLFLTADGSVGIGTTSPNEKLEVVGRVQIKNDGTVFPNNHDAGLLQLTTADGVQQLSLDSNELLCKEDFAIRVGNAKNITFNRVNSSENGADTSVKIDGNGNVGIGTNTPTVPLQINKDGAPVDLLVLGGNVGSAGTRAMKIISPASDSASAPFKFQTGNSFAFQIDSEDALTIADTGKVGIGTTNPSAPLEVAGNIHCKHIVGREEESGLLVQSDPNGTNPTNGGSQIELYSRKFTGFSSLPAQVFYKGEFHTFQNLDTSMGNSGMSVDGNITCNNLTQSSDNRLKENIQPLTGSLEKISQLNAVSYTDIGDEEKVEEFGFIAQDVQQVLPNIVKELQPNNPEVDYIGINYTQLIAPMVEAIKELKSENESLKARVEALENA